MREREEFTENKDNVFEFLVAEEIVKRMLSSLSPDDRFESAQEKIDKIIIDVSNFFSIKKVDALRFFESTLGMEPFIWFQTKMKKDEKITETTSGSVASIAGGFDPEGEWRSIYPVKKVRILVKKKKTLKNKSL